MAGCIGERLSIPGRGTALAEGAVGTPTVRYLMGIQERWLSASRSNKEDSMATYIAKNTAGEQVNLIEIEPEQIESWEALTGLILELPPAPEPEEAPDPAQMEAALNELGVQTRE